MATKKPDVVHCKYKHCDKFHETTELLKDEAVKGGKNSYYHPDCYHTMQTINEIRDLFVNKINPLLTKTQIGTLVAIINKIIFEKNINVDFLLFSVQYYIKYKPNVLKYPPGLHYIIQDKDVNTAWDSERKRRLKAEMQAALNQLGEILDDEVELDFGTPDSKFVYKPSNKSKFSNVLGV